MAGKGCLLCLFLHLWLCCVVLLVVLLPSLLWLVLHVPFLLLLVCFVLSLLLLVLVVLFALLLVRLVLFVWLLVPLPVCSCLYGTVSHGLEDSCGSGPVYFRLHPVGINVFS